MPDTNADLLKLAAQQWLDGNREGSLESIAQAIINNPHDPELYESFGRKLAISGKKKEALSALETAAALDFHKYWYPYEQELESQKQYESALAICLRWLQYLDGLKPGVGFIAHPSGTFTQNLNFVKSLEQHRAAAKRYEGANDIAKAIAEYKATIVCWELAYKVVAKAR